MSLHVTDENDDQPSVTEARWRMLLGAVTDHWYLWPQLALIAMMFFLLWDEQLLGKPAPWVVLFLLLVWGTLCGYEGMTLAGRRHAGRVRRDVVRAARTRRRVERERELRRMRGLDPIE